VRGVQITEREGRWAVGLGQAGERGVGGLPRFCEVKGQEIVGWVVSALVDVDEVAVTYSMCRCSVLRWWMCGNRTCKVYR
jgi:hypothetical protein